MKEYFFKKRVKANNINEALKKEPKAEITDVWFEERKEQISEGASAIGFIANEPDDNYIENRKKRR